MQRALDEGGVGQDEPALDHDHVGAAEGMVPVVVAEGLLRVVPEGLVHQPAGGGEQLGRHLGGGEDEHVDHRPSLPGAPARPERVRSGTEGAAGPRQV